MNYHGAPFRPIGPLGTTYALNAVTKRTIPFTVSSERVGIARASAHEKSWADNAEMATF